MPQNQDEHHGDEDKRDDRGSRDHGARDPYDSGDDNDSSNEKKRQGPNRRTVLVIGVTAICVIAAGGTLWWLHARKYESTDDAYIDAHITRVAPRVAGQVARVLVNDNQVVRAGDLLAEIDAADAQSRVTQVSSQQAQAETELAQARAQIPASEAAYQQAVARAAAADSDAAKAARDLERYQSLHDSTPKAVSQTQLDQAVNAAKNANAQRDAAHQQVRSAAAQVTVTATQIEGAQARIESLKAQVGEAQLNLGYTRIVAPIDGHVTQRSLAVGSYVSPGQQLMALVPTQMWVTANFKETQLALMRPSQTADVEVDACPDAHLHGHVDSIQRGAGQAFALLPPENATGNFVKVVQRVPVKIVFDGLPQDCPLGPGMSVVPTVLVR